MGTADQGNWQESQADRAKRIADFVLDNARLAFLLVILAAEVSCAWWLS